MLHQPTEEVKIYRTLWAFVHLLLMRRTLQVLIQGRKASEMAVAEVAFECVAIPSRGCGPRISTSVSIGIGKEPFCDNVV